MPCMTENALYDRKCSSRQEIPRVTDQGLRIYKFTESHIHILNYQEKKNEKEKGRSSGE